jgi:hypothetical protein
MRKITLGKMLYLFDAMGAYVVMTHPFGSGDDSGAGASGSDDATAPPPMAMDAAASAEFAKARQGAAFTRPIEAMPAHVREMLGKGQVIVDGAP